MDSLFVFVAGGLFVLAVMIYVLIMVFFPEWVGITGKKAIEAELSHRGEVHSAPATETIDKLEKIPTAGLSEKKID